MPRKSAFIKVSGDMCLSPEFLDQLATLSQEFFLVICVGGGTQINDALKRIGIERTDHGPLGRELSTFGMRQMARDVLERNQVELQDKLAELRIPATVIIPVLDIGSVLCHVNGDTFLQTAYLGFDQLFVVTTSDRVDAKKKQFANLPKVEVIGF